MSCENLNNHNGNITRFTLTCNANNSCTSSTIYCGRSNEMEAREINYECNIECNAANACQNMIIYSQYGLNFINLIGDYIDSNPKIKLFYGDNYESYCNITTDGSNKPICDLDEYIPTALGQYDLYWYRTNVSFEL